MGVVAGAVGSVAAAAATLLLAAVAGLAGFGAPKKDVMEAFLGFFVASVAMSAALRLRAMAFVGNGWDMGCECEW